jgi:hypothetical protein
MSGKHYLTGDTTFNARCLWLVTQKSDREYKIKSLIFNCFLTANNSDLADTADTVTKFPIIQCKLQCLNMNQCEQNYANLPSATTFFQNGTLKAKQT